MRNLAGRADCDRFITKELHKASIPIVAVDRTGKEVSASLGGRLGSFTFHRAWYYWVVEGLVPLHVAKRMHRHRAGKRVRVAGHCGAPHPNQWTERVLSNGGRVWPSSHKAKWDEFVARHPELKNNDVFSDDPALGQRYVTNYHIDTAEGLRLFAKMVRRYGLDGSTK